jgi:hypothetical protein
MKRLITWRNTELKPKTKKNKSEIISIRLTPEKNECYVPKDLPPKSTLYDYFDLWTYDG